MSVLVSSLRFANLPGRGSVDSDPDRSIQLLDEGMDDRNNCRRNRILAVWQLRRRPIVGHYTDSAVFFDGSCVLSLVDVKSVLPSPFFRSEAFA